MKRPLHMSGEIEASIKEVNAKQERQNSGGGTILGQVWGRLSANRSEQKEDAQLRQSLSPSRADDEERL